jgi:hypothetical protein
MAGTPYSRTLRAGDDMRCGDFLIDSERCKALRPSANADLTNLSSALQREERRDEIRYVLPRMLCSRGRCHHAGERMHPPRWTKWQDELLRECAFSDGRPHWFD